MTKLNAYTPTEVDDTSVEVWIQLVDEDRMKTLRIPPYYLKTVHLEKFDLVAPFVYAEIYLHTTVRV